MNKFIASALVCIVPCAAGAQDAVPDLTGKWTGTARAVIFGTNVHHPGKETITDPPRIESVAFTYELDRQDGHLIWGTVWSDPAKKEPVAFALSADNVTLFGADTDGHHQLRVVSADSMEACFTMNGLSPSGGIVATCWMVERQAE
jgi:hypothetical protein